MVEIANAQKLHQVFMVQKSKWINILTTPTHANQQNFIKLHEFVTGVGSWRDQA
jgi:hypothetical protein